MKPATLGPLFSSWRQAAPDNCSRLRELLADGQWHTSKELTDVAGMRFGARLFTIARGEDGKPPLHYEKRITGGDDRCVQYRATKEVAP